MDPSEILADKSIKPSVQSAILTEALLEGSLSIQTLIAGIENHKESIQSRILGIIEGATRRKPQLVNDPIFDLLVAFLSSQNPSILRESCRIIANVVHQYTNKISEIMPLMLAIATNKGTVVRWAGATAIHAISLHVEDIDGYEKIIKNLMVKEEQSSIKQIYLKALKTLKKSA